MNEKHVFSLPAHPGDQPELADITEYESDSDRFHKLSIALAEYAVKLADYEKWSPGNTPEKYWEFTQSISNLVPKAKHNAHLSDANVFTALLLNLVAVIIARLNEIIPGVEFSLERKDSTESGGGFLPFSQRIKSKNKYDTAKHSDGYHVGVELSADIYSNGKGKYAFVSNSSMLSFKLSQDNVEKLQSLSPEILSLGKTAVNKANAKPIPDENRVAFTWERTHGVNRGANYVRDFVDNTLYHKFHEERNRVYRHRLQAGDSIDDAGDFAESQTEKIMERLGLL